MRCTVDVLSITSGDNGMHEVLARAPAHGDTERGALEGASWVCLLSVCVDTGRCVHTGRCVMCSGLSLSPVRDIGPKIGYTILSDL